ncbi:ribonuclease-3 [Desulfitispora alkaliphila]|uniref:ribonuclease III n=1 Tax=Desulfitispora alkaliphila TaxID=622674 RepID=UPI003D1D02B2
MGINFKREKKLKDFVVKLKLSADNLELINNAFIHPTFVFENQGIASDSNQRLEFLGDAILGAIVARHLYSVYPEKAEGELTKMRAALVCEQTLAKKARELKLGVLLLLGKGEEQSGGRNRDSNLADAFEAFIGALYLQLDNQELMEFIIELFKEDLNNIEEGVYGDYKTLIQELSQEKLDLNVRYAIVHEIGPDHSKEFEAGVFLGERLLAKGRGRSKKEAEQHAAKSALKDKWWLKNEKG